ncbi:ABC transporter ATP-binding protein [Hoeflea alexandrii]|uniref:ABC transporter ATP-binding protein n=1 Tax=Hoeflea alexandrii TaxID=288436 RepID=UPI0022AF5F9F|nr:oligopeptide/dipeptide ABC transporter ATP-binding protein [Hoeflea alexandrii]MCZ4291010.1 ATP-binding cassette domain-containing protein [Hoeflea alexandrii]
MSDLLVVNHLEKTYTIGGGFLGLAPLRGVNAVSDVSFVLRKGETLALVGESGCGKSSVGRCLLRLETPSSGEIHLNGQRIDTLAETELRKLRKSIQVIFQDPFSSLNPRQRIGEVLAEPLRNFGVTSGKDETAARIRKLIEMVGLPADSALRWPHEFSGGQRQRVGIARALAANPDVIVCDEAVSALDVSVKAQVINLLRDLQRETGVALLFISHDLAVVENIAHQVAVMYLGRIVELAPRDTIFERPRHPYTHALLSAVPIPDPTHRRTRVPLQGDLPSPFNPPSGCRFHTRCPLAFDRCRSEVPVLQSVGTQHRAACHLNDLPNAANPMLTPPATPEGAHSQ